MSINAELKNCTTSWLEGLLLLALLSGATASAQPFPPSERPGGPQGPAATEGAVAGGLDAASGLALLASVEQVLVEAIERSGPSVVAIARVARQGRRDGAAELNFNLPGLQRPLIDVTSPDFVPTEFGSGVVLSSEGAILTCYHVLGDPRQNDYFVWHTGGPERASVEITPAQPLAGDPWSDLAVLKIDAVDLPAMTMGDASDLRRGQVVISLGNPYAIARDGQASASWGIVSNLQRSAEPASAEGTPAAQRDSLQQFGTLIQTDARLNLGTSGGALLNLRGEMIGLTTSLAAVTGFEQAAGYAIPIDPPTLAAVAQLRAGRTPAFGFLGIEPTDPFGDDSGALVRRVVPGLPADQAGLREGDLIVAIDDRPIQGARDLFRELSRRPAEGTVRLQVSSRLRRGAAEESRELVATLGKRFVALSRPGFSVHPEPSWRGMQVDFSTALPPERMFGPDGRAARAAPVAVLRVDPDTPAWRAGIRPGQYLVRVDDREIERPQEFYQLVESRDDAVALEVLGTWGRRQSVTVKP